MKTLHLPAETAGVFEEIITLPFYQDGKVYQYASHLLTETDTPSKYQAFIDTVPEERELKDFLEFFNSAIKRLEKIEIPQDNYEQWLFNQSDIPSVNKYKQLIHELYGEISLIAYIEFMEDDYPEVVVEDHGLSNPNKYIELKEYTTRGRMIDLDDPSDNRYNPRRTNHRKVLNRKNPFADVSIEDQTFLYASEIGGFKTLELNTSYTMTRIQKNELRSYLALQPGFKIRTSSRIDGRSESDISFDDTLTTEIAQDDNKVYIYLDAMHG